MIWVERRWVTHFWLHGLGKIDSKTNFYKDLQTFKDLFDNVIYDSKRVSSSTMIHFVFDIYIELIMKYSERLRRELYVMYEPADIYPCTALPSMMDSFWESSWKRRKPIDCACEYYLEHPMKAELKIVCSGYLIPKEDKWENRSANSLAEYLSRVEIQLPLLQQETEADMRIIPHLYCALKFDYDSFVVLTNNTDVLVLLLRYCAIFLRKKYKIGAGIGTETSTQYLSVH